MHRTHGVADVQPPHDGLAGGGAIQDLGEHRQILGQHEIGNRLADPERRGCPETALNRRRSPDDDVVPHVDDDVAAVLGEQAVAFLGFSHLSGGFETVVDITPRQAEMVGPNADPADLKAVIAVDPRHLVGEIVDDHRRPGVDTAGAQVEKTAADHLGHRLDGAETEVVLPNSPAVDGGGLVDVAVDEIDDPALAVPDRLEQHPRLHRVVEGGSEQRFVPEAGDRREGRLLLRCHAGKPSSTAPGYDNAALRPR